ncbi:hypothetical protein Dimus_038054 [Dionaea muscipula]
MFQSQTQSQTSKGSRQPSRAPPHPNHQALDHPHPINQAPTKQHSSLHNNHRKKAANEQHKRPESKQTPSCQNHKADRKQAKMHSKKTEQQAIGESKNFRYRSSGCSETDRPLFRMDFMDIWIWIYSIFPLLVSFIFWDCFPFKLCLTSIGFRLV